MCGEPQLHHVPICSYMHCSAAKCNISAASRNLSSLSECNCTAFVCMQWVFGGQLYTFCTTFTLYTLHIACNVSGSLQECCVSFLFWARSRIVRNSLGKCSDICCIHFNIPAHPEHRFAFCFCSGGGGIEGGGLPPLSPGARRVPSSWRPAAPSPARRLIARTPHMY